jgi:hypothetical protein
MFDLSWHVVYDKLNVVIFIPAAVFSLRPKEVRIWSKRLHEFYIEHTVSTFFNNTQPPMTIILTGNIYEDIIIIGDTSMSVLFNLRFLLFGVL